MVALVTLQVKLDVNQKRSKHHSVSLPWLSYLFQPDAYTVAQSRLLKHCWFCEQSCYHAVVWRAAEMCDCTRQGMASRAFLLHDVWTTAWWWEWLSRARRSPLLRVCLSLYFLPYTYVHELRMAMCLVRCLRHGVALGSLVHNTTQFYDLQKQYVMSVCSADILGQYVRWYCKHFISIQDQK